MNRFARLVLAWFLMSLGLAIAAPAVQPQISHVVCTGGAMKVVVQDEGVPLVAAASLDCPLCAALDAPAPPRQALGVAPRPAGPALRPLPTGALVVHSAAPLPARGPPRTPGCA